MVLTFEDYINIASIVMHIPASDIDKETISKIRKHYDYNIPVISLINELTEEGLVNLSYKEILHCILDYKNIFLESTHVTSEMTQYHIDINSSRDKKYIITFETLSVTDKVIKDTFFIIAYSEYDAIALFAREPSFFYKKILSVHRV